MIQIVQLEGKEFRIATQTFDHFSSVFRQQKRKARRQKAKDWWRNREDYLARIDTAQGSAIAVKTTRKKGPARTKIARKATYDRGRKR